jgi:hypothetical protein
MNSVIVFMLLIFAVDSKICFHNIRNNFLRMCLYNCEKKQIQTVSKIYHLFLSKIYDCHLFYYRLSDEEKDIIDALFSLCY